MITHCFAGEVYDCVLPRPEVRTADWAAEHIKMPQDSKISGNLRLDLFPHWTEPFDCFDDPEIHTISVMGSAQIGKTVFSQVCLAKIAATNPHPMAFADADERSTRRVIARTWRLFERCDELCRLCPPRHSQSSDKIELPTCVIHGAWAGSPASAADYGAFVVVLNETDKMKPRSTDSEADFRYLMGERSKGFVGAKVIEISTPTILGQSYIEARVRQGDNRRRLVPCPHCNHFQELRTGNGEEPGGVKFRKLRDGSLDPNLARETAYYECEKCRRKIEEHHRYEMLNAGVWVPEGMRVDKRGRLRGKPKRRGGHASFGGLSTLHSLLPGITIGVYAEEYVRCLTAPGHERIQRLRNFRNSWEGLPWDPAPSKVEPHELADRIGSDVPMRLCPEWSLFIVISADVGSMGDELIFWWLATTWGPSARAHVLDRGVSWSMDDFLAFVRAAEYPHADGGRPLRPVLVGIDAGAGDHANKVYELCRSVPHFWPLKGSSRSGFPEWFRLIYQVQGEDPRVVARKRKHGAGDLIEVNTERTEVWRENIVQGLIKETDPGRLTIAAELADDWEFLEHLLADYRDENGRWERRGPNEYGDALRY
ncbi:MAG: hypothetical protein GXP27_19170, partial [Planctomycetes bacterium]|nr:hypothetical protein [Planctomycetota bacterium]